MTRNAVSQSPPAWAFGPAKSPLSAAPRQRKARPAQQMMRVSRPVSRGNTALAHAFEIEMEPDPIAFDNVVPMSQRLSLLELSEATCTGRSAIPPVRNSSSAAASAEQPALLRTSLADRLSAGERSPPPAAEADKIDYGLSRARGLISKRDCYFGKIDTSRRIGRGVRRDDGGYYFAAIPIPLSQTGRRGRSRSRARCGSDPARAGVEQFAQPPIMHIHGTLVDIDIAAPHAVEQLLAAEHPSTDAPEKIPAGDTRSGRGRSAGLSGPPGAFRDQARCRHRSVRWPGARDWRRRNRPFTRARQFRHRERLDDVIVGAGRQPPDPFAFLAARGQHDDRQRPRLRPCPQAAAQLDPGQARQHPVEHDQVGNALLQTGVGVVAAPTVSTS